MYLYVFKMECAFGCQHVFCLIQPFCFEEKKDFIGNQIISKKKVEID